MVSDQLTFLLSFAAVFGALAWYLWRIERQVKGLEERLHDVAEADADAATPKNQDAEDQP